VQVVPEWNGHLACDLRTALRMTIEEFAEHLDMSPRGISKWEAQRDQRPQARVQQLLDVALSRATPEVKARFAQLTARSGEAAREVDTPAVLDVQAPRSNTPAHLPAPATSSALTWLRSTLEQQYSADNLLGPQLLLPALTMHLRTLEQMRSSAKGALLDEVLAVGAAYAEFAGWLSQDAGDPDGARTWYSRALEWAEAAGDVRLSSFVMTRRAVQALHDNEADYAVRLAQAAQRDSSELTRRVRAIAAQTEGLAHALAGDAGEVERAMASADALIQSLVDLSMDGDPSGGNRYCDLDLYLKISQAKALLTLGDADAAVTAFEVVLEALPESYRRDRGQYLARLAEAEGLAGLPEQGWASAREALVIAVETGSSRTVDDVRRVAGSVLAPWSDLPDARAVHDMLMPVQTSRRKA
jgi:transcriptional regulator with XRE-family HTH domain